MLQNRLVELIKDNTHKYTLYKRSTSDQGTHTNWKWGDRRVFYAKGNQKKVGVAILISDKIDFKIKTVRKRGKPHNDQGINPRRR